ncbi:hypothetical protein [Kribbella karoonensis]|uniref:Uncharacterized protein n=1 Tax=Kribbella karoonensis TaxID=324851 RepID=A0ABP4QCD6_9ACTN
MPEELLRVLFRGSWVEPAQPLQVLRVLQVLWSRVARLLVRRLRVLVWLAGMGFPLLARRTLRPRRARD